MPKRLVKQGVTVVRDGKRIRPEIGKNFDFDKEEIERITGVNPSALAKADDGAGDSEGEAATETSDADTKTPAKGGKKASTKTTAKTEKSEGGTTETKTTETKTDDDL